MGLFRKRNRVEEERGDFEAEGAPSAEPAPSAEQTLPGTAGYRRRRSGDVMPHRFTFRRPDGKTEAEAERDLRRGL